MKYGLPAMIFAFVSCADCAAALDASLASAEARQTVRGDANQNSESTRNVAASVSCREVDVALDEGYGVSRHETRYECETRAH